MEYKKGDYILFNDEKHGRCIGRIYSQRKGKFFMVDTEWSIDSKQWSAEKVVYIEDIIEKLDKIKSIYDQLSSYYPHLVV